MNNNRHDRFGKPIDIEKIKGFKGDTLLEHSTTIKELTHLSRSLPQHNQEVCYVCGSSNRSHVATIHSYDYFKCLNCTHVYLYSPY